MRRRGRRHRGTIPEDMFHFLGIVQSCNQIDVVLSGSSLPQHNTSERIRVQVRVCLNQSSHLSRREIEFLSSGIRSCWKTNEEFGIRVHGISDDIDPVIKVEMASVIHKVPCRTALGVVELNPDEVECSMVDGIVELRIGK